jgi:hypothetical protein
MPGDVPHDGPVAVTLGDNVAGQCIIDDHCAAPIASVYISLRVDGKHFSGVPGERYEQQRN